jgi:hypothetical protein
MNDPTRVKLSLWQAASCSKRPASLVTCLTEPETDGAKPHPRNRDEPSLRIFRRAGTSALEVNSPPGCLADSLPSNAVESENIGVPAGSNRWVVSSSILTYADTVR